MRRILLSFILITFFSSIINAQTVTGVLQDVTEKTPISNVTVLLSRADSTKSSFPAVTGNDGRFSFNQVPEGDYTLTATSVGYETLAKVITISSGDNNLGVIGISKGVKTLTTVVVNGAAPPVRQRDDTL